MEAYVGTSDCDDSLQVVDIKNLQKILTEDEIHFSDMTSLGTMMLLEHTASKMPEEASEELDDDTNLHRLSLAYERLHTMPKILTEELAPYVRILDLSNNEFESLDFLSEFTELTHLICDRNNITSKTVIPFLPKLELLWMNHCKISELYPWARKLLHSCPSLRYLSLMGNPIAPSFLRGGTFFEYLQYRRQNSHTRRKERGARNLSQAAHGKVCDKDAKELTILSKRNV
ncbi:uncharacterized protein LOC108917838 isoform X2 [Anoplophora glabripennis]|uniref:uncharacterized protein LOC108917838 isoform X2 n=1 Tax=Anoplophora glabripennis TaxID=217634 RepID=UPI0008738E26|nr:uncharacterized protein LOC108917838 isoform X2 [Anoplophora glabripennis]